MYVPASFHEQTSSFISPAAHVAIATHLNTSQFSDIEDLFKLRGRSSQLFVPAMWTLRDLSAGSVEFSGSHIYGSLTAPSHKIFIFFKEIRVPVQARGAGQLRSLAIASSTGAC
jgi:hypothetical protein